MRPSVQGSAQLRPAGLPSATIQSRLTGALTVFARLGRARGGGTRPCLGEKESAATKWQPIADYRPGEAQQLADKELAALIPHSSNSDPERIVAIVGDQHEAVDSVFVFVKGNRPLSTSYICHGLGSPMGSPDLGMR